MTDTGGITKGMIPRAPSPSAATLFCDNTYNRCSFYQKWQERSQRRFLSAVKALAQVRKLLGVNVQINIAEQQVNVAG